MWRSSLSFLLFPIILVPCSICLAQDTLHLSLNNCLQYAYGHNSTMQIAQLAVDRAEVSLHSVRWQFLPNINSSAGEYWSKSNDQPSHDFSMGVNASMTLFDGMSSWNNYKQSKLTLRQSQLQMQHHYNLKFRSIIGDKPSNHAGLPPVFYIVLYSVFYPFWCVAKKFFNNGAVFGFPVCCDILHSVSCQASHRIHGVCHQNT